MLGLQRRIGNAAVSHIVAPQAPLQRVHFTVSGSETLLNKETPTPTTGPKAGVAPNTYDQQTYTISGNFHMERPGSKVHVMVKIHFVQPDGTEIPDGDARKTSGPAICSSLVGHWNNKYKFVSDPAAPAPAGATGATGPAPSGSAPASGPVPSGPTPPPASGPGPAPKPPAAKVELPVEFEAKSVDKAGADVVTIKYHTNKATGQSDADPNKYGIVDAGNWFTSHAGGAYGTTPLDVVYAHEYGHLLGLADEYSLSNADMHAALHNASPKSKEMNEQLDKAATRYLVMQSLQGALHSQVQKASATIGQAVASQRPAMRASLVKSVGKHYRDPATFSSIQGHVRTALTGAKTERAVNETVRFEMVENLSYPIYADEALNSALDPTHVQALTGRLLDQALTATGSNTNIVRLPTSGGAPITSGPIGADEVRVRINDLGAATNTTLSAGAAPLAAAVVGSPPSTPKGARPAKLKPSPDLIGRVVALTNRWATSRPSFEAATTAALPGFDEQAKKQFNDPAFVTAAGSSVHALYRQVYNRLQTLAQASIARTVETFLSTELSPAFNEMANELMAAIDAEAAGTTTAAPGGGSTTSPGGPPDPAVEARAKAIHSSLEGMAKEAKKLATTSPATKPAAGAGYQTTVASTSYTVLGMMGSNHDADTGSAIRADHMQPLVDKFNGEVPKLRHDDEVKFVVKKA